MACDLSLPERWAVVVCRERVAGAKDESGIRTVREAVVRREFIVVCVLVDFG